MAKFEDIIKENMEIAGLPVPPFLIVALSGGADSVALAEALAEIGCRLVAVHCNYHLRGAESDRDAAYVRRYCEERGIPLVLRDFDVERRKAETGESTEMACRELRYALFDRVLRETGAVAVAVGHHREDNIETFFINLLRGSGLTGLTGMRLMDRDRHIFRPMLNLTRAEIEVYLRGRGVGWVNDSTNAVSDVGRNRLRNEVLPRLREQFPDADARIADSIGHLGSNLGLYNDMADRLRREYTLADGGVEIVRALRENRDGRAHPSMLLYELLRPWGFNISQCRELSSPALTTGARYRTKAGEYFLDRGVLRLYQSHHETGRIEIERVVGQEFSPTRDPSVIYLSPDALKNGATLRLRTWRPGDRLQPFGMRGSRLVSDILSDAKLPLDVKRGVRLLVRVTPDGEEEILWVCGLRASRHYPLSTTDTEYIMIRYIK